MPGPITPKEVLQKKRQAIPEKVFEIFNKKILESWDGKQAVVMEDLLVEEIALALRISTLDVYSKHLLDVEEYYIKAGWKVEYDKPGYCDSYDASFKFTKK